MVKKGWEKRRREVSGFGWWDVSGGRTVKKKVQDSRTAREHISLYL
jgi:hypothetical protein